MMTLAAVRKDRPDLILLDIMLPGLDGLDLCRLLKQNQDSASIPIVIITARGEESDIVAGLELGADDYITKPFSPRVVAARVRAVLRRPRQAAVCDGDMVKIHELVIHPGKHEVTVGGEHVNLTATEFQVLHFLAQRPGWVFTRYQIVDAVHGTDYAVTDRSVDVQIAGLRKKLGRVGDYIETVRGVGYRFKE